LLFLPNLPNEKFRNGNERAAPRDTVRRQQVLIGRAAAFVPPAVLFAAATTTPNVPAAFVQ
jgi:hypothetical protein